MSDKKLNNFELSRALNKTATDEVFDEIVKEIDTSEIPSKYIERILVTYKDGNQIELSNEDVLHPIPTKKSSNAEIQKSFSNIEAIKVYIDTKKLSVDVNAVVDDLFKGKLSE